jgi:hypothetical protein
MFKLADQLSRTQGLSAMPAGAVTFRLDEMHPGPRRRFRKITVGKREEDEQTYRALAETIRFDPRPGPSTTTVAPLLTRL